MSGDNQSPILEACAVIAAQIQTITDNLGNGELTADEIRALRRCELDMSKLEATAWKMLCELTTSDLLLEETIETVNLVDEAIDALHADRAYRLEGSPHSNTKIFGALPVNLDEELPAKARSHNDDFGFGIHGQHLGG